MQAVQLLLLVSGATLGAAWLAARFAHHPRSDQAWPALLLGVVAGLVAVVVVAVPSYDSVPDDWEVVLRSIALVAISAIAIFGSIYRLTRR
jgi:uncharacterized membrane protein HdeD (DUF308 family)